MHLPFQLQYHELRGALLPRILPLENDRANRAVDSASEWLDLILGDLAPSKMATTVRIISTQGCPRT
jgi:hypothetical protein